MTDNLQMGVRTRRLARAVLGCAAICAAASARADDYVLAAGETDAFAFAGGTVTNFTSMTVAGSLEITGDNGAMRWRECEPGTLVLVLWCQSTTSDKKKSIVRCECFLR